MTSQITSQPIPPIVIVRRPRRLLVEPPRSNSQRSAGIKALIALGSAGIAVGLLAAAFSDKPARKLQSPAPPYAQFTVRASSFAGQANPPSVAVPVSDQVSAEMEHLKTRNRRLEALVAVLRARDEHPQTAASTTGAKPPTVTRR